MTITRKPGYKKPRNQPQRNREVNLNHSTLKPDVSKNDLELLKRHLQWAYSSCWTLFKRGTGSGIASCLKGAKPLILRLAQEILSVHHVKKVRINVLIESELWKPFLPSGRTFRLTIRVDSPYRQPQNTSFLSSLMKFVVRMWPRCFFLMKDTDLHRNLVWTELRDVYLEPWVCFCGKPKRTRVDS